MLNDKYAMESSKLSHMESILSNIGFLSEEKEKEDEFGEKEEHKYKKSGKKSKDYDGDGEVEDESHEYAGVKDRAIKKSMKKESFEIDSIFEEMSMEDIVFLTDELIEETVEEFFNEMLEEGYDIEELSEILTESIDSELTLISEAKVTLGHDTPETEQKTSRLSKIKDVIKKAASGAKKVAKKVAGAAGEVAGSAVAGYKKGSESDSSTQTSPSSQTTSSASTSNKPSFLQRAGSALKKGLKKVVGKTARMAAKAGDKVATRLGEETLDEKAPAGAKYERMVKHIKKGYSKDGLTDKEKGIAYATAWKSKNKETNEEFVGEEKDPCWKGYQMIGMKKKSGKEVPNCVPKEEYEELVMDMIEEGYDMDQVRQVIGALEDGCEVIFEEDQFIINETSEMLDEQFLSDVEMVADWLHAEGIIHNEDEFFELMEDLSEEEIEELYSVVMEATAMAKRGYDEAPIRKKIAANTKGGAAADRATALADKQTFKGDGSARDKYARAQRSDHRKTTSSNPGLHGYAHKSNDPKVKAKQAARGAQRGSATLTPNERKKLNMGYEMIGTSLEEGGLEVRNYSWREVMESQAARNNPEKYEAGQKKKSAPVRGEKTPMPPRGDKRREDFEKWYAKNVR
jgi:hypothetical protein